MPTLDQVPALRQGALRGAQQVLAKTDPKLAANPLIFPTEATLSRVHLIDPAALKNQSYNEKWQAVLGA